ncbi:hypothetical protein [Dokdonella sp.]|uniref:hypothetical protein n=1 Tax=Dokdonella sp. TaxID=2291710 RepID=UPI00321FE724
MSTTPQRRQNVVDELGEIQSQILELVEQARGLLRRNGLHGALMRAESYWIAHVTTAVTNDHGHLGKSMVSLQDTIDEIEDGEDDDIAED